MAPVPMTPGPTQNVFLFLFFFPALWGQGPKQKRRKMMWWARFFPPVPMGGQGQKTEGGRSFFFLFAPAPWGPGGRRTKKMGPRGREKAKQKQKKVVLQSYCSNISSTSEKYRKPLLCTSLYACIHIYIYLSIYLFIYLSIYLFKLGILQNNKHTTSSLWISVGSHRLVSLFKMLLRHAFVEITCETSTEHYVFVTNERRTYGCCVKTQRMRPPKSLIQCPIHEDHFRYSLHDFVRAFCDSLRTWHETCVAPLYFANACHALILGRTLGTCRVSHLFSATE